jgi:hypothetical protein
LAALTSISGATPSYLAIGNYGTPYIYAASFSKSTGVGTQFANPASLPTNQTFAVEFNSDASRLAFANVQSPYNITNYAFSASGFGTKSADATLSAGDSGYTASFGVQASTMNTAKTLSAWVMDNARVAVVPFTTAGFSSGLRYGIGSGSMNGVAINTADSAIFGSGSSPSLEAKAWSNTVPYVGTAFSAPAGNTGAGNQGVAINSTDNVVAIATNSGKNVYAYAWSNSSGWGTKYTDTTTNQSSFGRSVTFSPSGNTLWAHTDAAAYQFAFTVGSGFGTRTDSGVGTGGMARFNTAGDVFAFARYSVGFKVYPWNGTALGTQYAGGTVSAASVQKLAFHG